ncbi:MAG: hypothetical protein GC147_09115 [Porphyrobacter sp.]|nr:hypothetical protein [Porphyrobacter sp.]
MDTASHQPEAAPRPPSARIAAGAGLRVVGKGLRLAARLGAPDADWEHALARLLGWLGIAAEPGGSAALHFAPWAPVFPAAFRDGGAGLPDADWAASYLFDHGQGSAGAGVLDLVLMSAHPGSGAARPGTLAAMIRAARAESRTRIALVQPADEAGRTASVARAHASAGEGAALDVLAIEEALAGLSSPRPRWDALIVSPQLRSAVFARLAQASGIGAPWPMVWHGCAGAVRICAESAAAHGAPLPLDAPLLVQALALALRQAGLGTAARDLHESAAQLRESGVVTPARGSRAPYVTSIADARFVELVCAGTTTARRAPPRWRALPGAAARRTGAAPRLALVHSDLSANR